MKKLKLSLSKQHNKMLKMKSDILKKWQNKIFRKNLPEFSRNFLKISRFPGNWKSEKTGNPKPGRKQDFLSVR